jgi:hypothetical protein
MKTWWPCPEASCIYHQSNSCPSKSNRMSLFTIWCQLIRTWCSNEYAPSGAAIGWPKCTLIKYNFSPMKNWFYLFKFFHWYYVLPRIMYSDPYCSCYTGMTFKVSWMNMQRTSRFLLLPEIFIRATVSRSNKRRGVLA